MAVMTAAAPSIPDDLDALKRLAAQQQQQLHEQQQRIAILEEYIRLHKHRQFGASTEKAPGQGELFNEAEAAEAQSSAEHDTDESSADELARNAARKPRGRKPLPAELPRVRIEHELPESEKACPCGCERVVIGEESSEQLDIVPAQVRVLVHVRKKYACRACEDGVKTASLPAQPIPCSNASAGLLAHVAVAKYQDALPLHRQERILARLGIDIPRHTLAGWMLRAGELVQPLLNLLNDRLLEAPVIHCDETPVQVLKEPDKPPESRSYMWVRVGGPPTEKIVLYDYAPSRRGEVAETLLAGYRGYLQTDDYRGYDAVGGQEGITHIGCWAHARRKFVEAQKAAAPSRKSKAAQRITKADMALNYIGKLYGIERRTRDSSAEERHALRQRESLPVLEQLRAWLDKTLETVPPKGTLGKALGYLDSNWAKLVRYTEDGRLAIDNNAAENAIRPFVIGRKNWLFSDSAKGARASAALYSLIETAKANGLEPYAYLRCVFKALPGTQSVEAIEALLPWNTQSEPMERVA